MSLPVSARPRRPDGGFSLVELAVVVAIISLLAAVAVPISTRLIFRARSTAVQNDLRVFAAAFQTYANEHGDWPAGDGTAGAFPPGMQDVLSRTGWQARTPIGGRYTWDPGSAQRGGHYRAAIVIASISDDPVSDDIRQLEDLDRRMDDGDLSKGNLVLGFQNQPVYVLEP
jgi:prepilin-type N-terminal cleavage/methylation domain-containing protein